MRETIRVEFDGSFLNFEENGCYESRGKSTIALIQDAYNSIPRETLDRLNPFSVLFYLGDRSMYPFSYSAKQYNPRTIPCHVFHAWKECGISDYDSVCNEMNSASLQEPKDSRLFWIGNAATHSTRNLFLDVTKSRSDVYAIDSGNWHGTDGTMKTAEKKYISLPEHCDYKYLIDIQGNGYSGRTKLLMHSGRPLFYQDREWHEYWFFETKPFVHYIPVKEDFSDLNEKLDWASENPQACDTIAANALAFAKANLRRSNAVKRYQDIIMMLGE
jgi:hypothetical protein